MPPSCECGHELDEHAGSGFFRACQVDECDCEDYDPAYDYNDDV
jgi:hypothetical protein